jgi:uncharacterized membrane protein YgcG
MPKKNTFLLFSLMAILFLMVACDSAAGTAISDPVIPQFTTDTGWWIDTTGRVSAETMKSLEAESESIKKDGFQLAGVIFSSSVSDGMTIATRVGNTNGIGTAGKDNGIVVVVFLDKANDSGDKPTITVAIGKGLEGTLNDAKVGRFLDQTFVPARKDGHWEQGVVLFVQLTHGYLKDPTAEKYKDPPTDYTWLWIFLIFLVIFLVVDGSLCRFQMSAAIIEIAVSSKLGGGGSFGGGGASR